MSSEAVAIRPTAVLPLACPRCQTMLEPAGDGRSCRACAAFYPMRDGILHLVAGSEAEPSYDPHYFEALPRIESRHFWFLARREAILDAIRSAIPDWRERPLFDIGCGTGALLQFLAEQGVPLAGACDAYVRALEVAGRRLATTLVLVDEGRLPSLPPGQRLLSFFDVLEHLDDDRGALQWACSVLEPGGALVLTVPAHPFLYGEADRLAFHRRRYRRAELREKLQAAGFEVRRLSHFMATLVPLLALSRTLRRLRPSASPHKDDELRVVPVLNSVLRAVLQAERRLLRRATFPFGSSLLAVAVRPPSG